VERKHGKKKRYVKLHFAVDVKTKKVVAMEVSTDDVHDVKVFQGLIEEARRAHRAVALQFPDDRPPYDWYTRIFVVKEK